MPGDNNLDQKITLDVEGYVGPLSEANQAQQAFVSASNKGLTDSSKTFAQHEKQVRQWAGSIKKDLGDFASAFKDNLATGAKALTLGLGTDAIRSAAGSAIEMALDAGKKFAELRSRVGGTEAQFKSWDKTIKDSAVSTKTNIASLQDAFLDLSDSASPDQIVKFMDQIGQATMLAHGNGKGVSSFVKSSLQGQGREFNSANVTDVLGGADLLRRKGTGFGTMEQAMSALGGMNQNAMSVGKLNEHGLAAMLSGASNATGDSARSTSALKELIGKNAQGQLNDTGALLGTNFKDKNGAFSLAGLGGAQAQRATHMGGDDATSLELFKRNSGLSEEASESVFKMIRNFGKLEQATNDASKDTKTLGTSAAEAGNNLKDTLQQASNKMVIGFEDILGGFQEPLNALLQGHYGAALKGAAGGIGQAATGAVEHPGLVAGAALATAAGGMLVSSLASKLFGGGKGGAAGIVGKMLGGGSSQHVWVDNAGEIRDGTGMSALRGGGIPGAAGAAGMGFMSKLGLVGAAAGVGLGVGGAVNDYANDNLSDTNKYGQKFNAFEYNIAKMLPEMLGGMSKDQFNDTYNTDQPAAKVTFEVHAVDPQFKIVPKAMDNARSGRTN